MSKTNKERLQDNNVELQNIKTGIDNLPEYQDIQKLYYTQDFTNYNTKTKSISPYANFFKNYFSTNTYSSYTYYCSIKRINDDGSVSNILNYSGSNFRYYLIFNVDENYIYYIRLTYEAWVTVLPVYKYKLDGTEAETPMFTITIPNSGIYYWLYSPLKNRIVVGNTSTHRVIDIDIEHNTYTNVWSKSIGGSTTYVKSLSPNTIYCICNSTTDTRHNTLHYVYNTNLILKPGVSNTINFVNYNEDKILINNTMYYLNTSNLTLGEVIKNNCIEDFDTNSHLFPISSDYYYSDLGVLYKYNDTDVTFEKIYETNTPITTKYSYCSIPFYNDTDGYCHYFYGKASTNLYAYKIEDTILFLHKNFGQVDNRLTNNVSLYDYYGNIVNGTMLNNGTLNYTPTTSQQTIPAGYTSGGVVEAITDGFGNLTIPSSINVLYERENEFDMELPNITGINWGDVTQWVKPAMKLKTESEWHYSDWEDEDTGEYYEFSMSIGSQYGEEENLSKVIGYNEDDGKYHLNLNIIEIYQNNYSNFDFKLMLKLLHPTMPTYKNCDITFNVSAPTDVFYDLYVRGNNISSLQDVTISVKDTNDNDIQYEAVYREKFGGIRIIVTTDKDGTISVTYNGVTETRPLDTTNNLSNDIYTYRFSRHEGDIEFN